MGSMGSIMQICERPEIPSQYSKNTKLCEDTKYPREKDEKSYGKIRPLIRKAQ